MKYKQQFPVRMFATAAIVSGFMMFVITAVFSQANAPCVSNYSLQNKVVVDTNSSLPQVTDPNEPLQVCNRNNQQIGWLTWFFKQSESVQFHYLDLLELLSRNDHS